MHPLVASGLLAYGDAPNSTVTAHILLTGIQTGPLALLADGIEAAAVVAYLIGVRRLARRGRRWSPWATAAFTAGMLSVWVAVGSGLAAYDEVNVVMHVVQHVLLMMIAAPLIALGKPITLATQASLRPNQTRLVGIVHHPVVAALTFPVLGWFLYYGTMYGYFMDGGVYHYSINHPLFHDSTHLIFLVVGYLYWQPLIGGDPTRWRLSPPVRILAVFLGMPFEAFLGIAIRMLTQPIDPINTLANTQSAGQTFWILAMLASSLCIAVIAIEWFIETDRQTAREDRRALAVAEQAQARAQQLGVEGVREGWTVPWWRLAQLEAQQRRQGPRPQPRSGPPASN
jgi:cytochrome c oxidase assembly factor CtaG